MAANVFLRNQHASRPVVLPLGDGHSRLLMPGTTALVPLEIMHSPAVARLIDAQILVFVDALRPDPSWSASERHRRAKTSQMERRVRAAEQQEVDTLLQNEPKMPTRRRPTSPESSYQLLRTAAGDAGLPLLTLRAVLDGNADLPTNLLASSSRVPSTEVQDQHRGDMPRWRQRGLASLMLLSAIHDQTGIQEPDAAAAWLIRRLIELRPP
jgi:hypothetical protein